MKKEPVCGLYLIIGFALKTLFSSFWFRWSFGVVLWEIFTLGGSPYPGLSADGLLKFLKDERRMEKPDDCPDEFYDLMIKCWSQNPDDRPTFAKLFELIADIIGDLTDAVSILRRFPCNQNFNFCENSFLSVLNFSIARKIRDKNQKTITTEFFHR